MTGIDTLAVLLGQHARRRDEAAAEHRQAAAARESALAQAEQLLTYRREYEARWRAQFARVGAMALVHCYQGFTDRLALAIEQQGRVIEHAAARLAEACATLREAELRCASVQRLIERRVGEARLVADRRDQKQTDEAATRAAWARLSATRPLPLL